jgi:hypothetical protein
MFEPVKGVLVRRGKHFVIKIVQQTNQAPFLYVGIGVAVTFRTRAHGRLDSQCVFTQAVAFGVFAQQIPGFRSVGHRQFPGS